MKVHQIETVVLPQGHGRPVCMCGHAQVELVWGVGILCIHSQYTTLKCCFTHEEEPQVVETVLGQSASIN